MSTYIIISGLPASGKSTLGRAVADALGWPCLDKDEFMEALFDTNGGIGDVEWRGRLSRLADEQVREQALALENAVIVSWWRHPKSSIDSGTSFEWLRDLGGTLIELYCKCDSAIASERFVSRTRHAGHLDKLRSPEEIEERFKYFESLGPLRIGNLVEVETESVSDLRDVLDRLVSTEV